MRKQRLASIQVRWLTAVLWLGCMCGAGGCGGGGETVMLERAHAHNDYYHGRPLLDALACGFGSVEADVHLRDGQLLVAHEPNEVAADRTLVGLYLEPLARRVEGNGGWVYETGRPFLLWIDIKTEAEPTYRAIDTLLAGYAGMLRRVEDGQVTEGAIEVIISGNRPMELMRAQGARYATVDGRLSDVGSAAPVHFMPFISDFAGNISEWTGEGAMPEADRRKLEETVRAIHRQGQRVRFWGAPDKAAVWEVLYEAGVDLINTDDLPGLRGFLLAKGKHCNGAEN